MLCVSAPEGHHQVRKCQIKKKVVLKNIWNSQKSFTVVME